MDSILDLLASLTVDKYLGDKNSENFEKRLRILATFSFLIMVGMFAFVIISFKLLYVTIAMGLLIFMCISYTIKMWVEYFKKKK